ncbi:DedA family protein [Patescibacteria group bacterium]|nr:DedA family protein [Patescibacteria group bacterium]
MEIIVNWLTAFITHYGLFAVFGLMTLESALIPIPSEVTMPFAGFLAGLGIMNFWLAIIVGAFGNLVGSLLAYALGYYKGEEWVRFAIKKWGKWLLMRESEYDRAKAWYLKYGHGITFASRLLPVVRTFISLPAGIARMEVVSFGAYTFIGSLLWSGVLAYVGLKLGQNWVAIEPFFRKFQFIIVGLFVLAVVWYVRQHLQRRKED